MRPDPHAPATVLVVENDPITREILENILQTGGFSVISMPTGSSALLSLCQEPNRITWLVTRVTLPGLVDGWILADEYYRHHTARPVILLSEEILAAEYSSINAVFVPPTAPMRVLEVLKGLVNSKPAQVIPFDLRRAA